MSLLYFWKFRKLYNTGVLAKSDGTKSKRKEGGGGGRKEGEKEGKEGERKKRIKERGKEGVRRGGNTSF